MVVPPSLSHLLDWDPAIMAAMPESQVIMAAMSESHREQYDRLNNLNLNKYLSVYLFGK